MIKRTILSVAALVMVNATAALGQDAMDHGKQGAFKTGASQGQTIGIPHVDIGGGWYYLPSKDAAPEVNAGFGRLHLQAATGIEYLQLASDVTWVGKLSNRPTFTGVLQLVPTKNAAPVYVALGAGMVTGASSNKLDGWGQAVLAVRTPIHVIAPFVQVGMPFVTGSRAQVSVGVAHPLMPYRFHLWH